MTTATDTMGDETIVGTTRTGRLVIVAPAGKAWMVVEGTEIGESFGRGTFGTYGDAYGAALQLAHLRY